MAKLLIAEDNAALANVLRFHLTRTGHEVTLVGNGVDALAELRQQSFDLLITDHQMPQLTGIELCTKIRAELDGFQTPILLLTAKRLELDVESLQSELGISRIFSKPFSPAAISTAVAELLGSSTAVSG